MREYSIALREELIKGLRPEKDMGRGTIGFERLLNVKARPYGLEEYTPVERCEFDTNIEAQTTWPAPQLFVGKTKTILAFPQALYEVDTTTSPWTLTGLETFYYDATGTGYNLQKGDAWHFVDLGPVWMLLNNKDIVCQTKHSSIYSGGADKVLCWDGVVNTSQLVRTACEFRGRVLFGGLASTNATGSEAAFWGGWRQAGDPNPSQTYGSNFVFWTSIGGGDLLWYFDKDLAEQGYFDNGHHDSDTPLAKDYQLKGDRGFMPVPYVGTVYCLKPLGKAVVVYGSSGVSALVPYVEPMPTFGLVEISRVGIANRDAMAGDEYQHVFVDATGVLCALDSKLSLNRLGYKKQFESMLETTIVGTFDPAMREFRLCNSEKGFLFSGTGLTEISQLVSSSCYVDSGIKGIFLEHGEQGLNITTDAFDLGARSIKLISTVSVGVDGDIEAFGRIHFRYEKGDLFQHSEWLPLNKEGVFFPMITGVDLKIEIQTTRRTNVNIDEMVVRYKSIDGRFKRGM